MYSKRVPYIVTVAILLFFVSSCATVKERQTLKELDYGRVTVVLAVDKEVKADLVFRLAGISLLSDTGRQVQLLDSPVTVSSLELKGRQMIVAEKRLPEGRYRIMAISIKEPVIRKGEGFSALAYEGAVLNLKIDTVVYKRRNTMVFLKWYPAGSIKEGYRFVPLISIMTKPPDISSLLAFITNRGAGTVSVINKHTGEIVDTVVVGSEPVGITAGVIKGKKRIYVANSGANSISVIDPDTHNVDNEIPVRFGNEPVDIAAERISPERELIFVANFRSNNVSVIDPEAVQELEAINVGIGPVRIVADPPLETVFDSRFLGFEELNLLRQFRERYFNVYVANRLSNSVSILKIDTTSGRAVDISTVDVDWSPRALYLDYQRGRLYVANYGSDRLSVINIFEVIKGNLGGAVTTINNVGYSVVDLVSDPSLNRLYLLRQRPAELVVIRPVTGAGTESIFSPVLSTIPLGGEPTDIELDIEENRLLIVNTLLDKVTVIDKTMNRRVMDIPVGNRPYRIAVLPPFLW